MRRSLRSLLSVALVVGPSFGCGYTGEKVEETPPVPATGPPPLSMAMTIQLGAQSYSFSCGVAPLNRIGPQWEGAFAETRYFSLNFVNCGWPKANPQFRLIVLFSTVQPSQGFPPGTYDLADPANDKIVVALLASQQAAGEVPTEGTPAFPDLADPLSVQWPPSVMFSSSTTVTGESSLGPSTRAAGVSGTVTVNRYVFEHDADFMGPVFGVDVSLSNVVLPSLSREPGSPDFPSTVTVATAHLEQRL